MYHLSVNLDLPSPDSLKQLSWAFSHTRCTTRPFLLSCLAREARCIYQRLEILFLVTFSRLVSLQGGIDHKFAACAPNVHFRLRMPKESFIERGSTWARGIVIIKCRTKHTVPITSPALCEAVAVPRYLHPTRAGAAFEPGRCAIP